MSMKLSWNIQNKQNILTLENDKYSRHYYKL